MKIWKPAIERIPVELRDRFRAEIREKTARSAWILAWICVLIWPGSTWLDFAAYGDRPFLGDILILRYAFWGLFILYMPFIWLAKRRGLLVRWPRPLAWGLIVIAWTFVTWAAIIPGGIEESYFGGLLLLLLAVLVAMPWSVGEMFLTCFVLMAGFNAAIFIFDPVVPMRAFLVSNYYYLATVFIGLFYTGASNRMRVQAFLDQKKIEEEKARSEGLLLNILPREVADELKSKGHVEARHIDSCSILFADFVGFTELAGRVSPGDLVSSLDQAFTNFDDIVTRWGLEKLKTIGDSYMCAGGVLETQPDHLMRCVLAGLEMLQAVEAKRISAADGSPWNMRIGLHSGPVVAGVIGNKRFAYDLWGDTVNLAARLETAGEPGSINLATSNFHDVTTFCEGVDRGDIEVRGKGMVSMTRVVRLRPEFAADPGGLAPNSQLMVRLESMPRQEA